MTRDDETDHRGGLEDPDADLREAFGLAVDVGVSGKAGEAPRSAERTLKHLRYVIASVNDDALTVWNDLWGELKGAVTPTGMVVTEADRGFTPACGWPEFLEKLYLLKHYLDFVHRFCRETY
jgi:hypothetical protein